MERNVNKRIENYIIEFKDDIKRKLFEFDPFLDKHKANQFLEYVYDYNRLVLTKEEFVKRKRIQFEIPEAERCVATLSSGERCSRRKKTNNEYCGTHTKMGETTSQNHNLAGDETSNPTVGEEGEFRTNISVTSNQLELYAEDIGGIMYYIDKHNNVYKTEDILENKKNPQIIAKCVKDGNSWKIPEFGL